jgi:hypothetical protein
MIVGVTGATGELGRQPVRYEGALRGRAAAT